MISRSDEKTNAKYEGPGIGLELRDPEPIEVQMSGGKDFLKVEPFLSSKLITAEGVADIADAESVDITLVLPEVNSNVRADYSFKTVLLHTQHHTSFGGSQYVTGALSHTTAIDVRCTLVR